MLNKDLAKQDLDAGVSRTLSSPKMTTAINWCLENLLPPVLRDPLVKLMIKIFFKEDADIYLEMKGKAPFMGPDDFKNIYSRLKKDVLNRETDLNQQSIALILENVVGSSVLDIACGKGYLTKMLANKGYKATGVDFGIDSDLAVGTGAKFVSGDIYDIPFEDALFDTVICAHTLEHVLDMEKAISELRRVAKKRLIIVVPRQREYKYGFNLHINFFPYPFSLLKVMRSPKGYCVMAGLDLFYCEDLENVE